MLKLQKEDCEFHENYFRFLDEDMNEYLKDKKFFITINGDFKGKAFRSLIFTEISNKSTNHMEELIQKLKIRSYQQIGYEYDIEIVFPTNEEEIQFKMMF